MAALLNTLKRWRSGLEKHLSDPNEPVDRRKMMLWAEMVLLHHDEPDIRKLLESLKPFVQVHDRSLVAIMRRSAETPGRGPPSSVKWQAHMRKRTKASEA